MNSVAPSRRPSALSAAVNGAGRSRVICRPVMAGYRRAWPVGGQLQRCQPRELSPSSNSVAFRAPPLQPLALPQLIIRILNRQHRSAAQVPGRRLCRPPKPTLEDAQVQPSETM